MIQIQHERKHGKNEHQKALASLLSNKCSESFEFENKKEIPENAIKCFDESYVIKKGRFVTNGLDILVSKKDAQVIMYGDKEKVDQEILRIVKIAGLPQYYKQTNNIIKWTANNCYELEKDNDGNLNVSVDFLKIAVGKNEIKVGKNIYKIPNELLN